MEESIEENIQEETEHCGVVDGEQQQEDQQLPQEQDLQPLLQNQQPLLQNLRQLPLTTVILVLQLQREKLPQVRGILLVMG